MLCDHLLQHGFNLGMLDIVAAGDCLLAFLDEGQKLGFLLGHLTDRTCREPRSAPTLRTSDLVNQGKGIRVQASGDYGASHKTYVYLVYI